MEKTELALKSGKSAIQILADRLHVSKEVLQKTLQTTVFKECKTPEEFVSAVIISNTYGLNPILKEIYAFPSRGGVIPIVSVDGWISMVNRDKSFNGVELIENLTDDGKFDSVTAKFYLKDADHPVIVTEYLEECKRETDTWKKYPRRMLRHKAYIQGARVAFGFGGIYDEDEAARIVESQIVEEPSIVEEKANVQMPKSKSEQVPENNDHNI
jgi:phage recombination protein Bet